MLSIASVVLAISMQSNDYGTALSQGRYDDARRIVAALEQKRAISEQKLNELRAQIGHRVWSVRFDLRVDTLRAHAKDRLKKRGGYVEYFCYRDTTYQKIISISSPDRIEVVTDSAVNKIVRVWPGTDGVATLEYKLVQTPQTWKIGQAFPSVDDLPADVKPYLGPTIKIDPTDQVAREIGSELKQAALDATILRTWKWWKESFKLGDVASGGPSDPRSTATNSLLQRTGYCWGQSKAVTSVLRAMGIPARNLFVLNRLDPKVSPAFSGYHAALEYYDPANGWLPFDGGPTPTKAILWWAPLAAEAFDDNDPFGTVVKSYYGMYNEGGNGDEQLRNVRITLLEMPFTMPQQ